METDKIRYTVIVDKELLDKVEDFRFENRYTSRSAATEALIRIGVETVEKQKADK